MERYDEETERCPACGDPIDYCQGHGEIGDPEGHAILQRHDDGDHAQCEPVACLAADEIEDLRTRDLLDDWVAPGSKVRTPCAVIEHSVIPGYLVVAVEGYNDQPGRRKISVPGYQVERSVRRVAVPVSGDPEPATCDEEVEAWVESVGYLRDSPDAFVQECLTVIDHLHSAFKYQRRVVDVATRPRRDR